jgi:hypothetical protein
MRSAVLIQRSAVGKRLNKLEIEVRPAQAEDFADPQTEAQRNQHHGPVGLRQCVEYPPGIFHWENTGRGFDNHGFLHVENVFLAKQMDSA